MIHCKLEIWAASCHPCVPLFHHHGHVDGTERNAEHNQYIQRNQKNLAPEPPKRALPIISHVTIQHPLSPFVSKAARLEHAVSLAPDRHIRNILLWILLRTVTAIFPVPYIRIYFHFSQPRENVALGRRGAPGCCQTPEHGRGLASSLFKVAFVVLA